jgi:AhpD family alkylhydroperoxidase
MATFGLIDYDAASPEVRAIYDEIMATRHTDWINNFWQALAHNPAHLKRTWASLKAIMAPGALDPLTKELMYVAVSVTNGCAYCIASHTAAAQKAGMSAAMFAELMAVVGMANTTYRLANGYQVAIDDRFRTPAPAAPQPRVSASVKRATASSAPPQRLDRPRAGGDGKRSRPHGCVHSTLVSRGQARPPGRGIGLRSHDGSDKQVMLCPSFFI